MRRFLMEAMVKVSITRRLIWLAIALTSAARFATAQAAPQTEVERLHASALKAMLADHMDEAHTGYEKLAKLAPSIAEVYASRQYVRLTARDAAKIGRGPAVPGKRKPARSRRRSNVALPLAEAARSGIQRTRKMRLLTFRLCADKAPRNNKPRRAM